MADKFQNFINGEWKPSKEDKYSENRNPANWKDDLIGLFPLSTKEDVNDIIFAVTDTVKKWKK